MLAKLSEGSVDFVNDIMLVIGIGTCCYCCNTVLCYCVAEYWEEDVLPAVHQQSGRPRRRQRFSQRIAQGNYLGFSIILLLWTTSG